LMVPDYQTLMAPSLQTLGDGEAKPVVAVREAVASAIGISDEDRRLTIPSGAPMFDSRVQWAVTYLAQAGLIRRPRRGVVQITDRGSQVLQKHPDRIDNEFLNQFEEFREFKRRTRSAQPPSAPDKSLVADVTPRETIASAVEESNAAVADEVLERVRQHDPAFLEQLVLDVLTAMGYGGAAGSAEHLGRTGDKGLDGVIKQDALGLDRIYVQAKRYAADQTIGRPQIQEFVGALHGAQADRGIFITTSRFSPEAYTYADRVAARLILLDGAALSELMVRHNIGVQDRETYVIKRIDEDYFEEP
jgi:restriction system protein